MVTTKRKLVLAGVISLHLLLVLLMVSETLSLFFNDASLRKGIAADFFAVYQAGYNAKEGESVYLYNEGVATPYSYPFRYLPFIAYIIGIPLTFLEPFTAYYLWVLVYEALLAFNVYLTYKLSNKFSIFLIASIPWLLFTPYLLELYMGQWTFLLASFLFYSIYGMLTQSKPRYLFTVTPLIKPNALLFAPPFVRHKQWGVLFATGFVTALASVPYFLLFPEDVSVFMLNFSEAMYSHGGNFGLKSLYAYIVIDLFKVLYPTRWFLHFTLLAGIFTIFLTFRYRNIVLHFTLWVCLFFMIYKDVWEHHYVLLMPIFSLIVSTQITNARELISKRNLLFVCSFLLIALPSLFVLQVTLGPEGFQEPNVLHPVFVILYHSTKILGVLLLYIWSVLQLMKEKTD
jgi:hypothetical protein